MFFFFILTKNSTVRPCCCRSAVFIGSSDHVLRIVYCWLWRHHCICLEQTSTGKRPKTFEAGGFPCWILHNTNFFNETSKLKFYLHCIYIIYVHTTSPFTFTFPFVALGNLSHLVLQNHSCMWCLVTSNKIFSLTLQKGDSIAGINYLKVKNDVIHCKTIISDRGQIHAAPNFSLLSSRISSYVTITCCKLLHQAIKGERKNGFRSCRNIFISDRDPQRFFSITIWCAILLQVV